MTSQVCRSNSAAPVVQDLETTTEARQASASQTSLLPTPDYVATDPTAMIAKLLVKSSQQKRESDELSTRSEELAEDAADGRRMEAMKSKADATLAAGMVAGFSQAASGAASFMAGSASAKALRTDMSATAAQTAREASSKWEGAGAIAGAGGKFAEAGAKSEADRFDRQIVGAESNAKQAKRAQDQLRRQIDAGSQHEGKVIQLLQEINQAQAQCARAALLRMA